MEGRRVALGLLLLAAGAVLAAYYRPNPWVAAAAAAAAAPYEKLTRVAGRRARAAEQAALSAVAALAALAGFSADLSSPAGLGSALSGIDLVLGAYLVVAGVVGAD